MWPRQQKGIFESPFPSAASVARPRQRPSHKSLDISDVHPLLLLADNICRAQKKKEILSLSTDKQQARKSNIGKIKFTCGHLAQPRRQEGLLSFFSVQAVKALHGRCHDGLHDARCHLPEVATPQAGQLAMLKLRVTFSA